MRQLWQKLLSIISPNKSEKIEGSIAEELIVAFGGEQNIKNLSSCITRLRVELYELDQAYPERLKALGAAGVITVENNMQAIFGTNSQKLMEDMKLSLSREKISAWIAALGNQENISTLKSSALTRIRVELISIDDIDEERLIEEGVEAVVRIDHSHIHLLVGLNADYYATEINARLGQL
ncbi:MAG: PTS transporter subunit EIIB [Campylobacterota bacterium]|nr:PTS transporter subunit EIIB [Campylobacterota bacterium]